MWCYVMCVVVGLLINGVALGQEATGTYPGGTLEFDLYYKTTTTTKGGAPSLTITRTIRGAIPFSYTNGAWTKLWCPNSTTEEEGEYLREASWDLVGSGTLNGKEEIQADYGTVKCKGRSTFTFTIELKGKSWWKPNENGCSDDTLNFSYRARYNEDKKGTIECQPTNVGPMPLTTGSTMVETDFSKVSETLEYDRHPGMTIEVEEQSGPTYKRERWVLHPAIPGFEDYDDMFSGKDDLRYESTPPNPARTHSGRFGPPLEELPILPWR